MPKRVAPPTHDTIRPNKRRTSQEEPDAPLSPQKRSPTRWTKNAKATEPESLDPNRPIKEEPVDSLRQIPMLDLTDERIAQESRSDLRPFSQTIDNAGPILRDYRDPNHSLTWWAEDVSPSDPILRQTELQNKRVQWHELKEPLKSRAKHKERLKQEMITIIEADNEPETRRANAQKLDDLMYSTIVPGMNIGYGVFAKKDLEPFTLLGAYAGVFHASEPEAEKERRKLGTAAFLAYAWDTLSQNRTVSGATSTNILARVNTDQLSAEKQKIGTNNLAPVRFGKNIIFYITAEAIKKGQQLFVSYGDSYDPARYLSSPPPIKIEPGPGPNDLNEPQPTSPSHPTALGSPQPSPAVIAPPFEANDRALQRLQTQGFTTLFTSGQGNNCSIDALVQLAQPQLRDDPITREQHVTAIRAEFDALHPDEHGQPLLLDPAGHAPALVGLVQHHFRVDLPLTLLQPGPDNQILQIQVHAGLYNAEPNYVFDMGGHYAAVVPINQTSPHTPQQPRPATINLPPSSASWMPSAVQNTPHASPSSYFWPAQASTVSRPATSAFSRPATPHAEHQALWRPWATRPTSPAAPAIHTPPAPQEIATDSTARHEPAESLNLSTEEGAKIGRNPGGKATIKYITENYSQLREYLRRDEILRLARYNSAAPALAAIVDNYTHLIDLGLKHNDIIKIAARNGSATALRAVPSHVNALKALGFSLRDIVRAAATTNGSPTLEAIVIYTERLQALGYTRPHIMRIASEGSTPRKFKAVIDAGPPHHLNTTPEAIVTLAARRGGAELLNDEVFYKKNGRPRDTGPKKKSEHSDILLNLGFTDEQASTFSQSEADTKVIHAIASYAEQFPDHKFDRDRIYRLATRRISKVKQPATAAFVIAVLASETAHLRPLGFNDDQILDVAESLRGPTALPALTKYAERLMPSFDHPTLVAIAKIPTGGPALTAIGEHIDELKTCKFNLTDIVSIAKASGGAKTIIALAKHAPTFINDGVDRKEIVKFAKNAARAHAINFIGERWSQFRKKWPRIMQIKNARRPTSEMEDILVQVSNLNHNDWNIFLESLVQRP